LSAARWLARSTSLRRSSRLGRLSLARLREGCSAEQRFTAERAHGFSVWRRRLEFLKSHWLVCGLFYGIAVFLVMNLIVLPLCALHAMGPYQLRGLIQGILVHMLIIGLPISFSLNRLARR
jgi:hypothetical protein